MFKCSNYITLSIKKKEIQCQHQIIKLLLQHFSQQKVPRNLEDY